MSPMREFMMAELMAARITDYNPEIGQNTHIWIWGVFSPLYR
jgi:hypothetical protein